MVGYIVITLGGMLFAAMVYRYDMHEREPWWMLVGAVIAGALGMAGAFALENAALRGIMHSGYHYNYFVVHALLAGTLEELTKLAVPGLILLWIKHHFNDPMDGLIYGSMAGLGAALYESVWWQVFHPADDSVNLIAAHGPNAMRLLMHTLWGGIVGYALGLIVMKKPWRRALIQTVGIVMAIHFAWDYFIAFVEPSEQNNWHKLIAAGLIGGSVCWYGLLVARTNKWSRAMHAPMSKQRLAGRIVRAILNRKSK